MSTSDDATLTITGGKLSNGGGRYAGLDTLKAICAFLVVCIHAKTRLEIGEYISTIGRIAVPIFLMITGYFYHSSTKEKKQSQIVRVLRLYLVTQCIYIIYEVFLTVVIPTRAISKYFSLHNIALFVLCNETTPDSAHLWYLLSLFYVLNIAYWLDTRIKSKVKYFACVTLIMLSLILGVYSKAILGTAMPELVTRNFLFVGVPYFIIGEYIYDNRDKLERILKKHYSKIAMIAILLLVSTLFEHLIVLKIWKNTEGIIYLTTPLLAMCIFVCFLFSDIQESIISKIGKDCSSTIYVAHLMIYEVSSMVCNRIGLINCFLVGAPIIVFISSLLYACTWNKIKQCFAKR